MLDRAYRFGPVLVAGLLAACSSSPATTPDAVGTNDGDPVRGELGPIPDGGAKDGEVGDSSADAGDASDAAGDADAAMDLAPEVMIDVPPEVPVDKPPPSGLGNGMPCNANSWCRSNFCIDGVCCNTACDIADPMRCNACSNARTGMANGTCAADRTRERMHCGDACGQVLMNVPAVLGMVCQQGRCVVPEVPAMIETCRKPDMCFSSFCNQPTPRTARCVHTFCGTPGTCCCEMPGNPAARSCMNMNACRTDRMCVTQ